MEKNLRTRIPTGGGPREFHQVWSLTQLYCVDFFQKRTSVKRCEFTTTQSRYVCVLQPCRLAWHTRHYPCISSLGKNRRAEVARPHQVAISSKSPKVEDRDERVVGRNEREQHFPRWGIIDFPSRQIYFLQEVPGSAQTWQFTGVPSGIKTPADWVVESDRLGTEDRSAIAFVDQLLMRFDTDNDGRLDYTEYARSFQKS